MLTLCVYIKSIYQAISENGYLKTFVHVESFPTQRTEFAFRQTGVSYYCQYEISAAEIQKENLLAP